MSNRFEGLGEERYVFDGRRAVVSEQRADGSAWLDDGSAFVACRSLSREHLSAC
jgi:hypothetical protein